MGTTIPTRYPKGRSSFSSVSTVGLPFPASMSASTRGETSHSFAYSICDLRAINRIVRKRCGMSADARGTKPTSSLRRDSTSSRDRFRCTRCIRNLSTRATHWSIVQFPDDAAPGCGLRYHTHAATLVSHRVFRRNLASTAEVPPS